MTSLAKYLLAAATLGSVSILIILLEQYLMSKITLDWFTYGVALQMLMLCAITISLLYKYYITHDGPGGILIGSTVFFSYTITELLFFLYHLERSNFETSDIFIQVRLVNVVALFLLMGTLLAAMYVSTRRLSKFIHISTIVFSSILIVFITLDFNEWTRSHLTLDSTILDFFMFEIKNLLP